MFPYLPRNVAPDAMVSFFHSWGLDTKLNDWTKRPGVVRTQSITWDPRNCPNGTPPFSDFSHSTFVTVTLPSGATIPKAKQQKINRVKVAADYLCWNLTGFNTDHWVHTPDIFSKINKLCPVDAPCPSNADSGRRQIDLSRRYLTDLAPWQWLYCKSKHRVRCFVVLIRYWGIVTVLGFPRVNRAEMVIWGGPILTLYLNYAAGYIGPLRASSSSNGPTTTPLTTRGFCPGGYVIWVCPKFVRPHWRKS